MKKALRFSLLIILLFGFLYGLRFGLDYANIASSYAAKTVCSCTFISKRPLASIQAEDLYQVPYVDVTIDSSTQIVSASIYGLATAKAIFRKGFGCTLINGTSIEELQQQQGFANPSPLADTAQLVADPQINQPKLTRLVDSIFHEHDPQHLLRTRAVVILHKGKIVSEQYAKGIHQRMPLLGWSMTKSVTSALIGILVKAKKLDIHRPAPVKEWEEDERKNITIDHLLRMSSGLTFEENYSKPSDATRMLFKEKGAGNYAISSKAGFKPNEKWSYSSGTSNILQEIIRRQFPNSTAYWAFPYQALFQKIGMQSAILEPDAAGTFIGSSFMYATARDWAKFGQLYLQDGVWKNERLLPEGWVKYAATETPHSNGDYAAHFWINHHDKTYPQDAFWADGFEGQSITIIPSKELVVVRLGCTPKSKNFDENRFIKEVVACVR